MLRRHNVFINMKKLQLAILGFIIAFSINAQNKKITEQTIKVVGICGDCKERIEAASDIKGVKSAIWNMETNELKVIFRNDKTSIEKIKQAIASAGYDAEDVKCNMEAYNKLPKCCQYKSEGTKSMDHNK
jgi:periplasmic mercuric ion binding protein